MHTLLELIKPKHCTQGDPRLHTYTHTQIEGERERVAYIYFVWPWKASVMDGWVRG